MIDFQFNDGGRADAGFKGKTGDCVTRAIAIATQTPYRDVYDAINDKAGTERRTKKVRAKGRSSARTGVWKDTYNKLLADMGWVWTPTMKVGQGCRVHLRADELPSGRIIVKVSRHLAAVIDGVLHDTEDCSRDGSRCVYGYWSKP